MLNIYLLESRNLNKFFIIVQARDPKAARRLAAKFHSDFAKNANSTNMNLGVAKSKDAGVIITNVPYVE